MLALVLLAIVALAVPASVSAGDVLVAAKGGKLTVKGSADPDELILTLAGQVVQVAPGGGTTLNGGFAPQTFTVTGKITIDLGAGDDTLTFDGVPIPTDLNVKLGDGFDDLRLSDSNADGKIAIDLGPGAGGVSLCNAAAAKGVSIKGGPAGPGAAEAGCTGVDNSDATVPNGTAIALGNFNTAGNLAVKLKTGDATVRMANSGAVGEGAFTFGDGVTLLGICDAGIGGNLTVKMKNGTAPGSIACTLGMASVVSGLPHSVILFGANVGGSATVKTGKNDDALVLNDSTIGEKLKVALSDGSNIASALDTLVGTSLTVTGGKGNDLVNASITVGDSAKLSLGAGSNLVALGTSTIGENLTVKTGDGDDTIVANQTVVGGKKTIKPGGGTNTVP